MSKARTFIKDRLRVGKWYVIGFPVGVACFALSILSFVAIVDSLSGKGTLFDLDLKINAYTIKVANPGLTAFLGAITHLGGVYLAVMNLII